MSSSEQRSGVGVDGLLGQDRTQSGADAKRTERERKQATKSDPMLDAVGNAEAAAHDARRQNEDLRELLAEIRDHVDLPEDIVAKIDAALCGLMATGSPDQKKPTNGLQMTNR